MYNKHYWTKDIDSDMTEEKWTEVKLELLEELEELVLDEPIG